MDKLNNYRSLIRNLLQSYLEERHRSETDDVPVKTLFVTDDEHGVYLIMKNGWQHKDRVQHILIFMRLHGDKIWVEEDWTDYEVVERLLEAGVPQTDIVLAFHHPMLRPLADVAAL